MRPHTPCLLAIALLLLCCPTGTSNAHVALTGTQQHHMLMMPCTLLQGQQALLTSGSKPIISRAKPPAVTSRRLLQSRKYPLSADPDNKGCYVYRAQSGDTIEQIARDLAVSVEDLKERNSKNIGDFSRMNGRFIQICSVGNMAAVEGVGGAPAPRLSTTAPAPAPAPPAGAAAPAPAAPAPAPAPAAPAVPAPPPAPAAPAPSGAPVAISLPSSSLSSGISAKASAEETATFCQSCASCQKCKDCAVCASAPTICFLNRGRASCGQCAGCSSCPSSGNQPFTAYEGCAACSACAECCPSFYSACSGCSMCQYCKYCTMQCSRR